MSTIGVRLEGVRQGVRVVGVRQGVRLVGVRQGVRLAGVRQGVRVVGVRQGVHLVGVRQGVRAKWCFPLQCGQEMDNAYCEYTIVCNRTCSPLTASPPRFHALGRQHPTLSPVERGLLFPILPRPVFALPSRVSKSRPWEVLLMGQSCMTY